MLLLNFLPNVPISLTQRKLLNLLAESKGIVTYEELQSFGGWPKRKSKGALEMIVFGLRKKLIGTRYQIVCHRGLGYSLVDKACSKRRSAASTIRAN